MNMKRKGDGDEADSASCGNGSLPGTVQQAAAYSLSKGADLVELDVRFTCDGAPIICHDPNALRLFGVDREIQAMELAEFLALRNRSNTEIAAYTLDAAFEAQLVPALLHLKCDARQLGDVLGAHCAFSSRRTGGAGDWAPRRRCEQSSASTRASACSHSCIGRTTWTLSSRPRANISGFGSPG